ncbi:MAG: diversity-generating retroelement protein Avd [Marinobacter sp.]|uniref:diversity-generating retroelement protein Avd n=1 Tax=Natronospirillum sp. TaxID=2812955 RepID=UPI0026001FFF|nr:diversity-generating retroelement protein Avd [Natronospirillum sp.]MCH8500256.1 diversity-generating retroelement protein Avd [Marinobacter sp.]MCH8553394.1 diversity-generating retroelement protein Avd [Natronospirillum sp.]
MNQEDLQIRLKVEEMIRYGYAALRQFPKSEKHVLSAEIRQCMYSILRLVIVCNRRYYKKTTMQDLDSELDLLRSLVRLSKELGFLPFKQYEVWSRHNDQIGCYLGKWMRWMKQEAVRRQAASKGQGR